MSRAHRAGPNAEATIRDAITTYLTATVYTHKEWLAAGEPVDCLVKNVPYTSIYGSSHSKTEFVLVDPRGKRTRIEVKWQVVSGSVDEKFPYLLENALTWTEEAVILVTGGGGAKKEAVDWLVTHAKARATLAGKDITVMRTMDEFVRWAHIRSKTWHPKVA